MDQGMTNEQVLKHLEPYVESTRLRSRVMQQSIDIYIRYLRVL